MIIRSLILSVCLVGSMSVQAQFWSPSIVRPSAPTTRDTLVLEYSYDAACTPFPEVTVTGSRVIADIVIINCSVGGPFFDRDVVTLGRLRAGAYTVEIHHRAIPNPIETLTVVVAEAPIAVPTLDESAQIAFTGLIVAAALLVVRRIA